MKTGKHNGAALPASRGSAFRANTGMLGATEPGQKVTPENISQLPPGSVVRNGDGSRLIHLHGWLWLWCSDHAWCYDRAENLSRRLDAKSVACHVAPSTPNVRTERRRVAGED